MMVKFVNRYTGGEMWVDETRVEEYKAAGHVPAADVQKPAPAKKRKSAAKTAEKK